MDAAIEYQAKLMEIKQIIYALNNVGIKGQKYSKKVMIIEETVRKELEGNTFDRENLVRINSENIYTKAIRNLELLKTELQKYNSYIEGYHYCEYLKNIKK